MSKEMKLWAIIDELRAENKKLEQTILKRVTERDPNWVIHSPCPKCGNKALKPEVNKDGKMTYIEVD